MRDLRKIEDCKAELRHMEFIDYLFTRKVIYVCPQCKLTIDPETTDDFMLRIIHGEQTTCGVGVNMTCKKCLVRMKTLNKKFLSTYKAWIA